MLLVILLTGIAIYMVRAWRERRVAVRRERWPLWWNSVSGQIDTMAESADNIPSDRHSAWPRASRFGLGAAARTAVPIAVDRRRNFLHRHVDAKRGRGLADDAADYVAIDGEPGDGRDDAAGVSGDSAGGRSGRYGGPAAVLC